MNRHSILQFADSAGIETISKSEAILLRFEARAEFRMEITVPLEVNEWFLSVYRIDSDEVQFSDWCDHDTDKQQKKDDVRDELEHQVIATCDILNKASVRIRIEPLFRIWKWSFLQNKILEIDGSSGWINYEYAVNQRLYPDEDPA